MERSGANIRPEIQLGFFMFRFGAPCALVAFAVMTTFASPAAAAVNAYLQIEGIRGEAQEDQHKDWIEVLSYHEGMGGMGSNAMASAGGARSRTELHEIQISKLIDSSSPKLHEAASSGEHFRNAVLDLCRAGPDGRNAVYMQIVLQDVFISSMGFSSGPRPVETITLSFAREEMRHPQANERPMSAIPMMRPPAVQPH